MLGQAQIEVEELPAEAVAPARTDPDDAQLVERTLAGDQQAFGELVTRYNSRVLGFFYGRLRAGAEAEDLAQEVFLGAYRSLGSLRNPSLFGYWLMRIARGRLIDHLRRQQCRPRLFSSSTQEPDGVDLTELAPDPRPGPREDASREQLRRVVLHELGRLDESHRAVLTMRLIDERSSEEIAGLLGLKPALVRLRLYRGLRRLRKALARYGYSAPGGAKE